MLTQLRRLMPTSVHRQQWLHPRHTHTHTRRLCCVHALCGLVKNLTCRKGLHYCDYCNKKEAQVILSSPRCVVILADGASCPLLKERRSYLCYMCGVNGEKSGKYASIRRMGRNEVERREKRATMRVCFLFLVVRDAIFIFGGP
jgi:hypothetical protein